MERFSKPEKAGYWKWNKSVIMWGWCLWPIKRMVTRPPHKIVVVYWKSSLSILRKKELNFLSVYSSVVSDLAHCVWINKWKRGYNCLVVLIFEPALWQWLELMNESIRFHSSFYQSSLLFEMNQLFSFFSPSTAQYSSLRCLDKLWIWQSFLLVHFMTLDLFVVILLLYAFRRGNCGTFMWNTTCDETLYAGVWKYMTFCCKRFGSSQMFATLDDELFASRTIFKQGQPQNKKIHIERSSKMRKQQT